ncbi:MAG: anti-sigma factor [Blastocatellia bacterium]|nr:anti-sigma factor [Blastocatellia bacterium]
MRHDKVNEQEQEKAALYALGALSQHEARAFEHHLRDGCRVCEVELIEFEKVVGELGYASPAAMPPPYLRDLLTSRIERESQYDLPATAFPEHKEAITPMPISPRRSFTRNSLPWAVAASLAIFALVSLFAWQQAARDASTLQSELASARSESDQLRAQAIRENEKANQLTEIKSALTSPGARMVTLAGGKPAPASTVRIYWDVQSNRWVVEADLPPPPEGKVYQLWFVTSDAKISAGLIKADHEGHGFAIVSGPDKTTRLAAAAITLEPEGGSEQPTSEIYAVGEVGI